MREERQRRPRYLRWAVSLWIVALIEILLHTYSVLPTIVAPSPSHGESNGRGSVVLYRIARFSHLQTYPL
jgi:hypothetical protein